MNNKRTDQIVLVAGWCAYASGVISLVGIVFLVLMFIGVSTNNLRFGTLNDICVIIQYLLALPITLALHQRLKAHGLVLSRAAMLIGITGIIAVIYLQYLLVSGVMT
jgi:hypothetical protein